MGHVEMARGCPYRCTYCINELFHEIYPKSKPYNITTDKEEHSQGYWRLKSVDRFLSEIKYLKERHSIQVFKIWDDDFLAMRYDTLKDVGEGLKNMDLKFLCHSRPEHMKEDKISLVAQNNCIQMGVGVECGSLEYRKKYLGRGMPNDVIVGAFNNCRKHKVIATAYCMIGMPNETREDIMLTANLLRDANPHVIVHAIFQPYPGNSLYRVANDSGYIDKDIDWEDYSRCYLNMPSISREEVEKLYRTFLLYCRFPDSMYPTIKKAEEDDKLLEELVDELAYRQSKNIEDEEVKIANVHSNQKFLRSNKDQLAV